MSRSRKKHPLITDRNPHVKRNFNRRVRRTEEVSNGGSFKRLNDGWKIKDYVYGWFNKSQMVDDGFLPTYRYWMK